MRKLELNSKQRNIRTPEPLLRLTVQQAPGQRLPSLTLRDRYEGAMLGLACGDAVGTSVEFSPRGSFPPVRGMSGGGPFSLEPGQWTDDTSMALCLAESLIARGGFDPRDQMGRYVNWWRLGYLSATGKCFDIGMTTQAALARFEATGDPFAGRCPGAC